jgi:hypothetical protein
MNKHKEVEVKIHVRVFSTSALGGGECLDSRSGPFVSGIHHTAGSLDSLVGIVTSLGMGDPEIAVLFPADFSLL